MAITQNNFTGDGSTVLFSFTFPYLETTDIKVTLNGVITTAYTLPNATTIQFTTAPANGVAIRIFRQTDDSSLQSTFFSGSAIRSQDLNDNFTQNLYVAQEVNNNAVDIDGSNPMVGNLNMGGYQIDNLAAPTSNSDAATKQYIDDIAISGLPNVIPSANVFFTQGGTGAVARTVDSKLKNIVSVKDFGAVGNGVTDDTAAVQAAINYFKSLVVGVVDQAGCVELDFVGGSYYISSSLNLTGIGSWGWAIKNGTIVGNCTGKAILDLTGSRGGRLSNLVVQGSSVNQPRVGIQSARSTSGGQLFFCDNMYIENVSVNGYFSLAAVYFYGQETTTHVNCQYWNVNPNGYAGIHIGYDWEPYLSDYLPTITGDTSYINDKYVNCDWRYTPIGNSATITQITKTNPVVITAAGHPFSNGDTVVIGQVGGMTQINNVKAVVSSATSTTFALTGVNGTAFNTYTSGGSAILAQTKPTILFGRAEQHSFDTCYCVNYGTDSINWNFTSGRTSAPLITHDWLFEGIGSRSHIRFVTGPSAITPALLGCKFSSYNIHARDFFFSTDTLTSETVAFYGSSITVTNNSVSTPLLLDTPTEYAFYGCDITQPQDTAFTPGVSYSGRLASINTGKTNLWNSGINYSSDGSWTPVVSADTGAITSYTATGTVNRIGDLVYVMADITITNNGTGAGFVKITNLPIASGALSVLDGRENSVSGKALQALVLNAGSVIANIRNFDNTYPGATGARLIISGFYKADVSL